MALSDKLDNDSGESSGRITRRGALRKLLGGAAAATSLATLPFGREAAAQNGQIAKVPSGEDRDAVNGRTAMNDYSKTTQGIGIYINLRRDSSISGDEFGQALQKAFKNRKPAIASEYRVNQSNGTGTVMTFYVRGVPYEVEMTKVKQEFPNIVARYGEAWSQRLSMLERDPQ